MGKKKQRPKPLRTTVDPRVWEVAIRIAKDPRRIVRMSATEVVIANKRVR